MAIQQRGDSWNRKELRNGATEKPANGKTGLQRMGKIGDRSRKSRKVMKEALQTLHRMSGNLYSQASCLRGESFGDQSFPFYHLITLPIKYIFIWIEWW